MKIRVIISAILSLFLLTSQAQVKVGIIGLDTSHSIAFTKELNGAEKKSSIKILKL